MSEGKKKFVILVQDGSPEKLDTTARIILSAVSLEMETHVFFTSSAMKWLTKAESGKLGIELDPNKGEEGLPEILRKAKELGEVKVYACSEAMRTLGVKGEDLVEEVDKTAGFVSFVSMAMDADVTVVN